MDDEPILRLSLQRLIQGKNHKVICVAGVKEAERLSPSLKPDLAIVDLNLQDGDGADLIVSLRGKHPGLKSILITGQNAINVTVVEAMKKGIFHFIPKPFEPSAMLQLVEKLLNQKDIEDQNQSLRENLKKQFSFNKIIGKSGAIIQLTEMMRKAAKSRANLLITGESGTGKELVARSIHCLQAGDKPFISVNCGAIPKELLESEFFGHVKGSFTGAVRNHKGYFETAGQGTLFLDEIGAMDINLQVKLLRVLQERAFKPVGSCESLGANARIISATNVDLEKAVEQGAFRKDLYYRLNIIPLAIPPLRQRREDIALLIQRFLKNFDKEGKIRIAPATENSLQNYSWPGNIRELENLIERLCVFKEEGEIATEDLPPQYKKIGPKNSLRPLEALEIPNNGMDFNSAVDAYENSLLAKALKKTKGNKRRAARLLNLNRTTLIEKIKKKGIKLPEGESLSAG